ncbi:hypothetical protein [Mucilaginibacter mallensis]|nr:hypothetical protein [Mucilaginibacter mallensis]
MKNSKKVIKISPSLVPYYQRDQAKRISWSAAQLSLAIPAKS